MRVSRRTGRACSIRVRIRRSRRFSEPRRRLGCSIDSKEYSSDFDEKDWSYLGEGIVIKTDRGAVVHFKEPNRGDVVPGN